MLIFFNATKSNPITSPLPLLLGRHVRPCDRCSKCEPSESSPRIIGPSRTAWLSTRQAAKVWCFKSKDGSATLLNQPNGVRRGSNRSIGAILTESAQ